MSEDNLSSKYFEGKPCRKCRSSIRYICNKTCIVCARNYAQKHHQANPEKHHEQVRKWQQANPEKVCEKSRRWQQAHWKKKQKYDRKWYQANSERQCETARKWQQANPEKAREHRRTAGIKTHCKRKQAEGSYTTQEWIDLREKYDNRCLCCGRHQSELDRTLERDHIVPLSKHGTNWISNIQPLCHDCNGMGGKGTKIIDYRTIKV
jgi:hypothetical protein